MFHVEQLAHFERGWQDANLDIRRGSEQEYAMFHVKQSGCPRINKVKPFL